MPAALADASIAALKERFSSLPACLHFRPTERAQAAKGDILSREMRSMLRGYLAGELSFERMTSGIQGWVNHARNGNTIGLRKPGLGRFVLPHKTNTGRRA